MSDIKETEKFVAEIRKETIKCIGYPQQEKPSVIILNTVKGKGYSKIEGTLGSHNMFVSKEMNR